MNRLKRYLANGLMLTSVGLLMRLVSVLWDAWIAGRLGESGIGLYSLVCTVYGLAVTFSVSGVAFACSRLCAAAIGRGKTELLSSISTRCMLLGLAFGCMGAAGLYLLAEPIGIHLLGDGRTVSSLRMLAVSLPAVSLSSALSGYFSGVRHLGKSTLVSVGEQVIRIGVTATAVGIIIPGDLEQACLALSLGSVSASLLSLIGLLFVWKSDLPKLQKGKTSVFPAGQILSTALPIAVSSYLRSGLLTVEHLLIPPGLRKSGLNAEAALASYGVIHGIAFSVVLFPQAFTIAFTSLLVPEMAEAQSRGDISFIRRNCARVLRFTLWFSMGCAAILICFSDEIGNLLYHSAQAGKYIRIFAILIPVMYTDSAVDHVLKGLGQQVYAMCVNIIDSACSVVGVWYLLPRYGIRGYICVLYFCECLNFAISMARLLYITRLNVQVGKWIFLPLGNAAVVAAGVMFLLNRLPQIVSWPPFLLALGGSVFLYGAVSRMDGVLTRRDGERVLSFFPRREKTEEL